MRLAFAQPLTLQPGISGHAPRDPLFSFLTQITGTLARTNDMCFMLFVNPLCFYDLLDFYDSLLWPYCSPIVALLWLSKEHGVAIQRLDAF